MTTATITTIAAADLRPGDSIIDHPVARGTVLYTTRRRDAVVIDTTECRTTVPAASRIRIITTTVPA